MTDDYPALSAHMAAVAASIQAIRAELYKIVASTCTGVPADMAEDVRTILLEGMTVAAALRRLSEM
jgi:hypothetical protein